MFAACFLLTGTCTFAQAPGIAKVTDRDSAATIVVRSQTPPVPPPDESAPVPVGQDASNAEQPGQLRAVPADPAPAQHGRPVRGVRNWNSHSAYGGQPVGDYYGMETYGAECTDCYEQSTVRILPIGCVCDAVRRVAYVPGWGLWHDDDYCDDCKECERRYPGKCNGCVSRWWNNQVAMFYARNRHTQDELGRIIRGHCSGRSIACKCGYFIPSGSGGAGTPPIGTYSMVYPLNPHYVDPRDKGVYAAQGYGVPMTVPLAPVVEDSFNYSWGIPSSRLTPISRTVP